MKKAILVIMLMLVSVPAFAIKWVSSSNDSDGGYYRDTSNDGNQYNNANYLGYNRPGPSGLMYAPNNGVSRPRGGNTYAGRTLYGDDN